MKKIILMAGILAAIILTGCSEDKNSGEAPVRESKESQTEYVMQDGDTQVTGEVTSIVGNEVTLDLGEVTENEKPGGDKIPDEQMPEGMEIPEGGFGNGEMPEGIKFPEGGFGNGEMPEGMEIPEGGFGNGEMPGGMTFPGSNSSSIEKNGETASYTIPAGMTISGANGRNSDYTSVSAGMILRLTLNSDGYVVAAEII